MNLNHKGFNGRYSYDQTSGIYHGEVEMASDVVIFQADKECEIENAFRESIDDYLEMVFLDSNLRR